MDTLNPGIKPIEIFKPGSFTAMNGQSYTFTAQQVRELADTYNPDFADAHCNLGLLLESVGNRTEAMRHLMLARQLMGTAE